MGIKRTRITITHRGTTGAPKKSRGKKPRREYKRKWHEETPGAPRRNKVYISAEKVEKIIRRQLAGKLDDTFELHIADGKYFCPPVREAREIIDESALDKKEWVDERFDCDDFAVVLKAHFAEAAYAEGKRRSAHCFGIVWGELPDYHAINWMINADLKLRFVEPQLDTIYRPKKSDKGIWFMLA